MTSGSLSITQCSVICLPRRQISTAHGSLAFSVHSSSPPSEESFNVRLSDVRGRFEAHMTVRQQRAVTRYGQTSLRCCLISVTICGFLMFSACCSGVMPFLFLIFSLAWYFSISATTSRCPLEMARCKGVSSLAVCASVSAP